MGVGVSVLVAMSSTVGTDVLVAVAVGSAGTAVGEMMASAGWSDVG